jgi:hypothetical protein
VNLKAFHLAFIAASSLLAVWLGVFCLRIYLRHDGTTMLLATLACFAGVLALVVYGSWFVRKARQL